MFLWGGWHWGGTLGLSWLLVHNDDVEKGHFAEIQFVARIPSFKVDTSDCNSTRCWFHVFLLSTPTWRNKWLTFVKWLETCWNHQLENVRLLTHVMLTFGLVRMKTLQTWISGVAAFCRVQFPAFQEHGIESFMASKLGGCLYPILWHVLCQPMVEWCFIYPLVN